MPTLICPLCGLEQDASGPGVGSVREEDREPALWKAYWIPFIEDIRGTPSRLVNPACFAREHSLVDLVALITEHDRRTRLELYRAWQSR